MAFYHDIGKKISQTGQGAVQKSKDLTESARLQMEIGSLEKEVGETYKEIGRIYYDLQKDQPQNPELGTLFQKAAADLEQINEKRSRIEFLKGAKTCANCGGQISPDAAFCRHCGAPVMQAKEEEKKGPFCPNCGAVYEEGQKFCVACGQKLGVLTHDAAPAEEAKEQEAPAFTAYTQYEKPEEDILPKEVQTDPATNDAAEAISADRSDESGSSEEGPNMILLEQDVLAGQEVEQDALTGQEDEIKAEEAEQKIAESEQEKAEAEQEKDDIKTEDQPSSKPDIFCTNCGKKLPADTVYCTGCGRKILSM